MTQTLSGLGGINQANTVGNETPDWEFPYGKDRVSQEVQKYFFRADAGPTGMNAAEKPSAAAVEEFRRLVNTGIIRPKNEAASNIARSQGGLRAGDQSLLGPIINSMPEGLTPEYWAVVIQKAQQAANEQIAIMNATGYFEGKSTLDRQRIEAEISDNIAKTEIQRRLADNTIRQTDMDDAYKRDAMAQDMRQNIIAQFGYDPGPQGAAGLMSGNKSAGVAGADGVQPIPGSQGTPDPNAPVALQQQAQQAEQSAASSEGANGVVGQTPPPGMPGGPPVTPGAGQYPQVGTAGAAGGAPRPNMTTAVGTEIGRQWVDGQGWVQTLGGRAADLSQQQQAFAQQQAQAELASNPRNYIQAQMLGNARGGMAGMAPNNQVGATTQYPGMPGMQQPGMPGGMQWPAQPVPDGLGPEFYNNPQYQQMMTERAQAAQTGDMARAQQIEAQMGQLQQGAYAQQRGQAPAQPLQAGMPTTNQFQAPGNAGMGATAMQASPMAQPMGATGMQQPGGVPNIAVGAFSNALNQNRLVPKSGAMGTQGSYQSMGGIQQATNPQKWRAQDFMRGNASEKQQALGTASAAGFSDEDTQSMLGKSLPTFKAPGAGAMV